MSSTFKGSWSRFASHLGVAVLVLVVVAVTATPTRADVSVFVRFGDGMIVSCPSHVATGYCQQGGVIVPYVPQQYIVGSDYYNGYRAYYPPTHNRVRYRHVPRGNAWGYYNHRQPTWSHPYRDRNRDGYPDRYQGRYRDRNHDGYPDRYQGNYRDGGRHRR